MTIARSAAASAVLITTMLMAEPASAQTLVYSRDGTADFDRLGYSGAHAGDVNNDGFPDFIAGGVQDLPFLLEGPGMARIYSGIDGSTLHTLDGLEVRSQFGYAVAGLGDINADGHDDVIVGAYAYNGATSQQGRARVFSGLNGAELFDFQGGDPGALMGTSVASAGDLNGDLIPDILVGAPGKTPNGAFSGSAMVFSGANGFLLLELEGTGTGMRRGLSVCGLGDVNPLTDDADDIAVGSLTGGVVIYNGLNGDILQSYVGGANDIYGGAVARMEDHDSDGIADLIIGAPQSNPIAPGPGYIELRSSVTGLLLMSATGPFDGSGFGTTVDDAGDWNGDGVRDVIVGMAPISTAGDPRATIVSGVDGSVLTTFLGDAAGDGAGRSVAGLGDVDGNGKLDVLVGHPNAPLGGALAGRVRVYENQVVLTCGDVIDYCASLPNSTGSAAALTTLGSTSIADNGLILLCVGAPQNEFGIFYYGNAQINVPFGNGVRCVAGPYLKRLPALSTGPSGSAAYPLDFTLVGDPNVMITAGSQWNFQYWFRDTGVGAGTNLSNAISVTFCP